MGHYRIFPLSPYHSATFEFFVVRALPSTATRPPGALEIEKQGKASALRINLAHFSSSNNAPQSNFRHNILPCYRIKI